MDSNNLIAWAINGEDMPLLNGHPLRLVIPGWPGSCSQKWLTRISVIDKVHDGAKMIGKSYRVPAYPVAPGTKVPDEDMEIIHSLPVKSLITYPVTGTKIAPRQAAAIARRAGVEGEHCRPRHRRQSSMPGSYQTASEGQSFLRNCQLPVASGFARIRLNRTASLQLDPSQSA